MRGEHRKADYNDAGLWQGEDRVIDREASDSMFGGQLSLSYDLNANTTAYTSISRGYKAGGFNLGAVPSDRLEFQPEYLWNYELGVKRASDDRRYYADTTVFYSRRRNMQVRTGDQLDPSDPNSYVFFTDNASSGYNYGLETSLRWQVTQQWDLNASFGLLRTRLQDYDQGGTMLPDRAAGARAEVSRPRWAPSWQPSARMGGAR